MHPLTHFLSGLIGERHGQDLLRQDATRPDEVRDAVRNDPRFARPRTSQNQQRAIAVLHGFLVWRVELSLQNRCHVPESSIGPASMAGQLAVRSTQPCCRCRSSVLRCGSSAWGLTPRTSWASATATWATRRCSATARATTSVRYCSPWALWRPTRRRAGKRKAACRQYTPLLISRTAFSASAASPPSRRA